MPEIRLVYDRCGHVDRWDVSHIPPHEHVEERCDAQCGPCHDRDHPPVLPLEDLAQAQYEREHPQRKRRHR